eukprot:scaffold425_cov175-Amphora_coffeaeformis.AAC.80
MVSWGPNQVHTLPPAGAPAAGGFSFGTPTTGTAPAPAPFGSPAPASGSGGFSFGLSTPAAASGGTSFFGSPAPAAAGGVFGSSSGGAFGSTAPAPAPIGGGLFGSPAPSSGFSFGAPAAAGGGLFGGSSGSLGGSSTGGFGAQQQQVPQIPAQAAFQAYQQTQAREAEAYLNFRLQKFFSAYNGSMAAPSETESAPFTTVLYNPATTEYQMRVQNITGNLANPAAKPLTDRPVHISQKDWEVASLRAPRDHQPTAAVGAEALQTRVSAQQQQADQLKDQIKRLREFQKILKERKEAAAREGVAVKTERLHKERKQRLWQIMQKLEIIRAYGYPIQRDEGTAIQHAKRISKQVEDLASQPLPNVNAVNPGMPRMVSPNGLDPVDPKAVVRALEEHHEELLLLSNKLKKNLRDTKLLTDRLSG